MKRLLLVVSLLAVVAGGYFYYTYLRDAPASALMQAARATQTHDVATFERFVDIDALTRGVIDDVTNQSALLTGLVPGSGLMLRGGLSLVKPQLAAAARTEVKRFVETGSIKDAQAASPRRLMNISFLGLAGRVIGPNSTFKGIKYTKTIAQDAWVGIEFTQPRYDTTMVAEVMLQQQPDGHWQAKRISNTGAMLQQVVRLERRILLKN